MLYITLPQALSEVVLLCLFLQYILIMHVASEGLFPLDFAIQPTGGNSRSICANSYHHHQYIDHYSSNSEENKDAISPITIFLLYKLRVHIYIMYCGVDSAKHSIEFVDGGLEVLVVGVVVLGSYSVTMYSPLVSHF